MEQRLPLAEDDQVRRAQGVPVNKVADSPAVVHVRVEGARVASGEVRGRRAALLVAQVVPVVDQAAVGADRVVAQVVPVVDQVVAGADPAVVVSAADPAAADQPEAVSRSGPSARNSTTWRHRPSEASVCRWVVAKLFAYRAARP
ncbi:MAG: hypothetical protein Q8P61_03400 [Candidatus Nanopelagicales bacterium]|nr:hypothetical protein [Candidatus Nanopelagicales bacterium]